MISAVEVLYTLAADIEVEADKLVSETNPLLYRLSGTYDYVRGLKATVVVLRNCAELLSDEERKP